MLFAEEKHFSRSQSALLVCSSSYRVEAPWSFPVHVGMSFVVAPVMFMVRY